MSGITSIAIHPQHVVGQLPRANWMAQAAASEDPAHDTFEPSSHDDDVAQMCLLRRVASGLASVEGPCQPEFAYDPLELADLREAQGWEAGSDRLSGTDANARINDTYDRLDRDMTRYLGEPAVASWMTFGKYASREAGEQIRNLENVEKAVHGDVGALGDAASGMASVDALEQATLLGGKTALRGAAASVGALAGGRVVEAGAVTALRTAGSLTDTLGTMRDALVEGNTEIYHNIAPAYDAFLEGEARGTGGLQALADAGWSKGSEKDPQGFVSGAFEHYAQARTLGQEAARATDPDERQRLLDERKALMNQGNLLIGLQEQMVILQRPSIYGDGRMQQALDDIGGTMSLTDANGKHALRPDGRSWAGFEDRMGLARTTADDPRGIAVRDHDGVTRHYVPDPAQQGTIYRYFTENVDGEAARNLIEGSPRPL